MSKRNYETRREAVLDVLHDGPCHITEIASEIGAHYETVRGHIRALMEAGLVELFSNLNESGRGRGNAIYQLTRTKRQGG